MTWFTSQPDQGPTLCFPDKEKSCFACCPPIRPADYEHIQHRTIIQRMLRENTRAFDSQDRKVRPITGFSCWALGYLDDVCGLVGCLLHPARNQGADFRFLTEYGEKCRRESCPESRIFLELSVQARRFWLTMADGLDSFQYSSKRVNPLFRLLGWGSSLLEAIAMKEGSQPFSRHRLSRHYPVLESEVEPRANAYLLNHIRLQQGVEFLGRDSFARRFEQFSAGLMARLKKVPSNDAAPFTHLLPLDPLFLDLLRLGAGIRRIRKESAVALRAEVNTALSSFEAD